jgi:hypothetical protein
MVLEERKKTFQFLIIRILVPQTPKKREKKSENNVQHLPDFPPSNTNINK